MRNYVLLVLVVMENGCANSNFGKMPFVCVVCKRTVPKFHCILEVCNNSTFWKLMASNPALPSTALYYSLSTKMLDYLWPLLLSNFKSVFLSALSLKIVGLNTSDSFRCLSNLSSAFWLMFLHFLQSQNQYQL